MVEFINKLTGGLMYVHESRVAEYEALGHVRAEDPLRPSGTSPIPCVGSPLAGRAYLGGGGEEGSGKKAGSRKKAAAKAPHP